MSTYVCPKCGHVAEIFGNGGVFAEAKKLAIPFLGEIPLDLDVRLSGDSGCPVSASNKPVSQAFNDLAKVVIKKLL
jgi:ATP-binding protein involved in chromosome partitioning